MSAPDLPNTLQGYPVRWERRGREDDETTRGGWTAVVDGSRSDDFPPVEVSVWVLGEGPVRERFPLRHFDGEPLSDLDYVAWTTVRDDMRVEIRVMEVEP